MKELTRSLPAALDRDIPLLRAIAAVYSAEADLLTLPQTVFVAVKELVDADVVSYSEVDLNSREFRGLVSVEEPAELRAQRMAAYGKHMHSHPFWSADPKFFGDRALRESDFFPASEFRKLPIAREALLPARARHTMAVVLEVRNYVVRVSAFRVIGRRPFQDVARDRMQGLRPHLLRAYRQAQDRTVAALNPVERLRYAFPALTPRQLDVAAWLSEGKSNDAIAAILGVGIDAVKAHVRALLEGLGVENRLGIAIASQSAPPFQDLPPLWKLPTGAWSPRGQETLAEVV